MSIHRNVNFKIELIVFRLQLLGFTHRVFGILLIQFEDIFEIYTVPNESYHFWADLSL